MSKKIRIGIVGAGMMGRQHTEAIRRIPGTLVVALADEDFALAQKTVEELNIPKAYGKYTEMIEKESLDAVHVYKDEDGEPIVEKILDTAGQKGTGKWTAIAALDEGVPLTLIGEAVFSRCLSAMKDERVRAAEIFNRQIPEFTGDKSEMIENIRKALYASKIISYAQGYTLMRSAAKSYGWKLNYGGIALMWRGGCIIRSIFLGKIKEAYDANPELDNLLLDPYFKDTIEELVPAWRKVVSAAVSSGIPVPAMASALSYFDGYTTDRLPANLLQAQRDYFGAHTYERLDAPRGRFFHTNWTGHGGSTAAETYNA